MILVNFLLFSLIIVAKIRFSVLILLSSASDFFHSRCLERFSPEISAYHELQALVCGENFSTSASQLYMASGLIHLFVVSGAHLVLVEKFLTKFLQRFDLHNRFIIVSILFIYVLACGLNPPSVRSFVSLIFSIGFVHFHLRWPEGQKVLFIGFYCLILNPEWITSISLQLSWIAALVVSMLEVHFKHSSRLLKQSAFFILLFPLIFLFQSPHPVTILANLLFTPLLEAVLFPLGLLTWLFPFIHPVFDFLIHSLQMVLSSFEFRSFKDLSLNYDSVLKWGWYYIFSLHILLHFSEMDLRRKTHV